MMTSWRKTHRACRMHFSKSNEALIYKRSFYGIFQLESQFALKLNTKYSRGYKHFSRTEAETWFYWKLTIVQSNLEKQISSAESIRQHKGFEMKRTDWKIQHGKSRLEDSTWKKPELFHLAGLCSSRPLWDWRIKFVYP